MTEAHPLCLIGERQHEAHDGTMLCRAHFEKLGTILREIENEAALLDAVPSLAISHERSGGTLASEKAPARLDVLVLTDRRRGQIHWAAADFDELALDDTPSVLEVLGTWARLVREERALSIPKGPATVTAERDTLTRQLFWVAQQPWIDEFYADVTTLLRVLKRTNGTLDLPVGDCGTFYGAEQCDGKVWHATLKRDGEPDEPGFRCSTCRRVWTGTEAVRKRDDMWRDEQARKETA